MANSKTFPKQIFVTIENSGTEDEYYNVNTNSDLDALSTTDKTRVATYDLKEVKEGKLEPVFSTIIG